MRRQAIDPGSFRRTRLAAGSTFQIRAPPVFRFIHRVNHPGKMRAPSGRNQSRVIQRLTRSSSQANPELRRPRPPQIDTSRNGGKEAGPAAFRPKKSRERRQFMQRDDASSRDDPPSRFIARSGRRARGDEPVIPRSPHEPAAVGQRRDPPRRPDCPYSPPPRSASAVSGAGSGSGVELSTLTFKLTCTS